jgi:hypothetical protein
MRLRQRLVAFRPRLSWDLALVLAFAVGSGRELLFPILVPSILGSHAVVYTDAARAWLTGGDPWAVGPPLVVFAGPPPMLLPFAPFVVLPELVTRIVWVLGTAVLAVWSIRRLRLPPYWIAFPPILGSIILGHPEIVVLFFIVAGGAASGLAVVIKPYAGFILLAERRWKAILVAAIVGVATLLILPWARFFAELPVISANLARQGQGESVFGDPVLMVVAIVSLIALGLRRGLWLVTPILWPYAQTGYMVSSVPAMSRVLAMTWALPIHGVGIVGLALEAILVTAGRRMTLPGWLQDGIGLHEPVIRVPAV